MEQCKHKKWSKWTIKKTPIGVLIQVRSCKKCGWSEYKQTEYYGPSKFKEQLKPVVKELLDEISSAKVSDKT